VDASLYSIYAYHGFCSGYDGFDNTYGIQPAVYMNYWNFREGPDDEILMLFMGNDKDNGNQWGLMSAGLTAQVMVDSRYASQDYINGLYNWNPLSLTGKYLLDHARDPDNDGNKYMQVFKDGAPIWSQMWGRPSSQLPPSWGGKIIDFTVAVEGYSICSAMYSCTSAAVVVDGPLISPRGKYIGIVMTETWSMISGPWPVDMTAPGLFGIRALYGWSGY
jgi:hypothetical protein